MTTTSLHQLVERMNILKKHGLTLSFGTLLLLILATVFSLISAVILTTSFAASIMDNASLTIVDDDPFNQSNLIEILQILFSDELQPIVYNFLVLMVVMILLIILIHAFITIGLTSSVYEAVFLNQSEIGLPIERGFSLLWKSIKLYLALFLVFLPLQMISMLLDLYLSEDMFMVNLALQILFILIQVAVQSFVYIIAIDQNLTTWKAIKAGFICFQKKFGYTLLTTIFAILSFAVVLLLTGLLIFFFSFFISSSGEFGAILLFIMAFLLLMIVIPVNIIIFQLILTTRYKNVIRPVLFPEPTPAFTTPFKTE